MGLTIDVLVNNAGFGVYGPFADADPERLLAMLRVNVLALTDLTRLFLPGMVSRGRGRVLNVASIAAFQPGPLMAGYYATKAYVLSLSEALRRAARDRGDGDVPLPRPDVHRVRLRGGHARVAAVRQPERDGRRPGGRRRIPGHHARQRVAIPGLWNRLGAFATRFVPRSLLMRIVERIQAKRSAVKQVTWRTSGLSRAGR